MRNNCRDGSLAAERTARNVGKERSLAAEEPLEMWGKGFLSNWCYSVDASFSIYHRKII